MSAIDTDLLELRKTWALEHETLAHIREKIEAAEQRGAAAAGALAHAKEIRDDKAGSTHVPASCLYTTRLCDAAQRARELLDALAHEQWQTNWTADVGEFLRELAGE